MGSGNRGRYRKDHISEHRSGWRYKRAVPADLRGAIGCAEWSEYLGTDRDAAGIRAAELTARDNERIKRFRTLTPDERKAIVTRDQLDRLLGNTAVYTARMRALVNAMDGVSLGVALAPPSDMTTDDIAQQRDLLNGRKISEGDLAAAFQRARVHAKAMEVQTVRSDAVRAKTDPDIVTGTGSLVPVWESVSKPRSLDTIQKMKLYAARFDTFTDNIAPRSVTRQHAIDYRDELEKNPKIARSMGNQLHKLKRLFKVALGKNLVDLNPFDDVAPNKSHDDGEGDKRPFELEQVEQIFDALPSLSPDSQWIWRLLAYHGARSGEICHLGPEDVTTSMGIPILRIRRKGDRLKTKHSARDIPIHPACMDIVEYAAKATGPWLFASLPYWKKDGKAGKFQQDASKFLRKNVGITDKRLTAHCLRHTFGMIAAEIDMPEPVARAIMGHTQGKDDHAHYGKAHISLKKRAEWIAKINPLPRKVRQSAA